MRSYVIVIMTMTYNEFYGPNPRNEQVCPPHDSMVDSGVRYLLLERTSPCRRNNSTRPPSLAQPTVSSLRLHAFFHYVPAVDDGVFVVRPRQGVDVLVHAALVLFDMEGLLAAHTLQGS